MLARLVGSVLALVAASTLADAEVRLSRLFSDGVVLQQKSRVAVFGSAAPGETVRVRASFGAQADAAIADAGGHWKTWLETPAAGGPFTLEVRGRNTVRVSDVWVGEVWLASGQSNMEIPVGPLPGMWEGALDWERETGGPEDPPIHLFTVENGISVAPRDDVQGAWTRATRDEVLKFGATPWFFARQLRAELRVPVGIVESDVGGSTLEAWISTITLATDPDYAEDARRLEFEARAPERAAEERARTIDAWQRGVEESDRGLAQGFARAAFDDSRWESVRIPGELGGAFAEHDGVIWLRRTFETPGAMLGKDAVLSVGRIDDYDSVFFDGELVGSTLQRQLVRTPRSYPVPKRLMTPGRHAIAIRIDDLTGSAGVIGSAADVRLRSKDRELPLDGAWKAHIGAPAAMLAQPSEAVDFGMYTPSSIYNAMVAPLTAFRFAGVIWYQGESDARQGARYRRLFPELIEDWRARFGVEALPFYFVQIAPFVPDGDREHSAELREAQRQALALPATGMVATNDVGDAHDIHPRRKREVGERLAAWALARTYGRERECTGPLVDERRSGPRGDRGEYVVAFEHAEDLHFSGPARGVLELSDGASGWVSADARIEGETVVLSAEGCPKPVGARLDSTRGDRAHLLNRAGLPAAAFVIGAVPWASAGASRAPRPVRKDDALVLVPPFARPQDGVPLANGLLGALVRVEGGALKILLERSDFWDLRRSAIASEPDWNARDLRARLAARDVAGLRARYEEPFTGAAAPLCLPLCEIEIPLAGRTARIGQLELARGEAGFPLDRGYVGAFVSAARPLLLVRVDGITLAETPPERFLLRVREGSSENDAGGVRGEARAEGAEAVGIAVQAVGREAGIEIAIATASQAEDAFPAELARTRANEALGFGYAPLLGEHLPLWGSAQASSRVRLGDEALQTLYDAARYVTFSALRRGAPLVGVTGPWTTALEPPSRARALDLETLLGGPYAAGTPAGLCEGALGAGEFLGARLERFREYAGAFHGLDGVLLPGRITLDGSPLGSADPADFGPGATAWMAELLTQYVRCAADEEFARRVAGPFCREAARALLQLAPRGPDGRRRPAFSGSPGWSGGELAGWLTTSSNHDLALLRAAFRAAADLSLRLGAEDDARAFAQAAAEVAELDVDAHGALSIAPGIAYQSSLPTLAHAVAIQPLASISIEGGAEERALVDATLDGILSAGTRGWTGATFARAAALAARAGRPETARRLLLDFQSGYLCANGLSRRGDLSGRTLSDIHDDDVDLTGEWIAMEAVHEMLLQSWGGVVRVFPSASVIWHDAEFENLRAEGGFQVSARRAGGITRSVTIRATEPARLRLRDPFGGREPKWSRGRVARQGGDWVVDLGRGEELIGNLPEKR